MPSYSDEPESRLARLVQPSLDRIGRLLEREQGAEGFRACVVITRADPEHFRPDGNIAVGVGFAGAEDLSEAQAKRVADELIIDTLVEALDNFARAADYPLTIVRPSNN